MSNKAEAFLAAIGGAENVTHVEGCITRIRLEVKDTSLVGDVPLREAGAFGVVVQNQVVQIIVGPEVDALVEDINALL